MSSERLWPQGYGLIVRESLDSTNSEARRLARTLSQPTWILARRQTAGRGRGGADWISPSGNFAATLVMKPGGPPIWASLRSFMAANAVYEALALHLDRDRLALKWPNDVLLDGGKIAGILLESASTGQEIDWLAVGIGVNLAHAPDGLGHRAFPPVAADRPIPVDVFLHDLADFYATEEALLSRMGFAPIRESWLEKAARLGDVITARTGTEQITGRFETIDEDGSLILVTKTGERRISAAEVFF
ncbi:biotin--[acetyl-CoA-carboxylase] ligase [Palleronia caenipelagi]|uniref:biotin--[biotin carboxyl-carrier protein] ligase n=1 Tax=Palleronia caenipelagi TaxID=2489174 RepID=A0A547Q554_9RHOB|nr:biotin--[acetyl-CoA-carboxylase] ligase [Palleronia caenipelagi]TRD21516.1 biotin--[acetyl-CoA-carboxylase] ligase [Palleronia caenipelagi]